MLMYYTTNTANNQTISFKKSNPKNNLNFFDYFEEHLQIYGNLYAKETIKTYKTNLSKLRKFKQNVFLDQINKKLINDYTIYMQEVLDNSDNTIYKTYSFIKSTLNKAIQDGLIEKQHNPFNRGIKIKTIKGNREHLNITELKKLHRSFHLLNKSQQNVLTYFLFSCYTGLRFTDIKLLELKHVKNDIIVLKQHKTSEYVRVPLNKNAKKLISCNIEDKVFKVYTNQATNRILKQIATICDINKVISFHVARHTFATVGISLEIPIEFMSKLLGHTSIKTTSIYVKIGDNTKRKNLDKFNF